MSSDSEYGSSASRVKAFRSRLAGQYKRVEAYVTEGEKSAIDDVKAALGVTTDVAVAGLLRLGLERFEQERVALASKAPQEVSAVGVSSRSFAAPTAALAASQESVGLCSPQAAVSLPPEFPVLMSSSQDNPIARFFKNRKETTQ